MKRKTKTYPFPNVILEKSRSYLRLPLRFLFNMRTLYLSIFCNLFWLGSLLGHDTTLAQEKNKVILITGASRGIGWEAAKKLALQGHHVYASMRSTHSFTRDPTLPSCLQLLELDVTDELSITRAMATLYEKEGRLDVLVNNAGCAVFGPLEVITVEQAKKTFEVNFFGTMRLMQAALPLMREQNKGLIINISSTSGVRPSPGWDIYAASKFAIEGMSEAVAAMARQWNIDVVLVEPGTTATEFMSLSTETGARCTPNTQVYEHFVPNALKWMEERLADGQNPADVAAVICTIVGSDQHHLRYQTSPKGEQTVAARHCDPTGSSSIQEQEKLIKQLWQGPLDTQAGSSYR